VTVAGVPGLEARRFEVSGRGAARPRRLLLVAPVLRRRARAGGRGWVLASVLQTGEDADRLGVSGTLRGLAAAGDLSREGRAGSEDESRTPWPLTPCTTVDSEAWPPFHPRTPTDLIDGDLFAGASQGGLAHQVSMRGTACAPRPSSRTRASRKR
jgi:hypothetical protein